ncbi:protein of unknown function [Ralstonia solanacearum CMR15]|nr:protein of unknown function [Ralstonia solanacearum CMR15]
MPCRAPSLLDLHVALAWARKSLFLPICGALAIRGVFCGVWSGRRAHRYDEPSALWWARAVSGAHPPAYLACFPEAIDAFALRPLEGWQSICRCGPRRLPWSGRRRCGPCARRVDFCGARRAPARACLCGMDKLRPVALLVAGRSVAYTWEALRVAGSLHGEPPLFPTP